MKRNILYLLGGALVLFMTHTSRASDTVLLHAAGSLRGALTDVSNAFEKSTGVKVVAKYGPSGLLESDSKLFRVNS